LTHANPAQSVVNPDDNLSYFIDQTRRPVGAAKNLKLDKHADKIDGYLDKGINKVAIAKLLAVSPNTPYEW
jgi:hypothetical protein